ncbi:MAG: DinB family protein [Saprospiraceae bacterium]
MKEFLIEMFDMNQVANIKMVSALKEITSPEEGIRHLSHLVNCQYKWLDRINVFPETSTLDWWEPVYSLEEMPHHFIKSTRQWIIFLSGKSEDVLNSLVHYTGYDGSNWEVQLKDVALQLIFHSFHHRAQIQMMIKFQGFQPGFIDYIGYKQKKIRSDLITPDFF